MSFIIRTYVLLIVFISESLAFIVDIPAPSASSADNANSIPRASHILVVAGTSRYQFNELVVVVMVVVKVQCAKRTSTCYTSEPYKLEG